MITKNELIKATKNDALELVKDIGEMSIDEVIRRARSEETFLEKLPLIKWFFIAKKLYSDISAAHFIKKYASFIGPIIMEQSYDFWEEKIKEILGDEKTFNKLMEQTVIEIDRYQTEQKAALLGKLFVKTFQDKLFTIEEYNILLFSLELMHPYVGIERLKDFYNYRRKLESENNEEEKRKISIEGAKLDFSPLSTSCLLSLPKGASVFGSHGGAFLNDLGKKFCEYVVE